MQTKPQQDGMRLPRINTSAMRKILRSRALPWVVFAGILVVYAISVVRLHPTNFFGFMEDDGIYFSSAQALAQGHGYIVPSVPGAPPATKYPILYPLILSWVWRWNPSFPSNLRDAIGLNIVFGFFFLAAAFAFLRRMKGLNDVEALAITAFCALHPIVGFYTGSVLSEIPFAAVALWALIVADKATKPESGLKLAIFCGILAGLSTELRFVGLGIIAGIALAALLRRAWRQFFAFSFCSGAFLIPGLYRALFSPPAAAKFAATAASSLGWQHEWAYYMNYPAFYKMSVPDLHTLRLMLEVNVGQLALGPSQYFLFPSFKSHVVADFLLVAICTFLVWVGILRHVQADKYTPVNLALCFFALIALAWDYPMFTRFFIPFLPLIAAALWLETKRSLKELRRAFLQNAKALEKIAMAAGGVAIVGTTAILTLNILVRGRNLFANASRERGVMLKAKRQAYDWISQSTARDSRVLTYEDGSSYLYTGREAMRPITLTVETFYEPARLPSELDHMTDVARAIHASYWIVSDDDYRLESPALKEQVSSHASEIQNALPLVFKSDDGRVRVYGLGCLQHPEAAGCEAADRVLFPPQSQTKPAIAADP